MPSQAHEDAGALTSARHPSRARQLMTGPGSGLTWGQRQGQQLKHPGSTGAGLVRCGSCQLPLGPKVTVVQALGQPGVCVVAGGRGDGSVCRTSLLRHGPCPSVIPPLPSWGQALGLDVALPQHQASLLGSSSWESPPFPATVKLSLDIKQTRGVEHIWTRISSESEGNGASEGRRGRRGGWTGSYAHQLLCVPAAVCQGPHVPSPPYRSENRGSPGVSLPTPALVPHPLAGLHPGFAEPSCLQRERSALPSPVLPWSHQHPPPPPRGGAHHSPNHRG